MTIKTKSELKARFKTGDKPTQQDFADVIDSSVSTINGEKPDSNGNVVISNTSQSVQQSLEAHEKVVGTADVLGHLKLQNEVNENTTNAITPAAVKEVSNTLETVNNTTNQLIDDMLAQQQITDKLTPDVEALKTTISSHTTDIKKMNDDITELDNTVKSLTPGTGNDLSGIEADITALQTTTTQQTSDITALQTTTTQQTSDITALQTTTTQQTSDITTLQTNLETITHDYPNAKAQIEHNRKNIAGVTETVLAVQATANQNASDIALIIKELNLKNGDEPTALTALTTIVTQLQQAVTDLQNGTTPETTPETTTPEEPTE